MLRVIIPILALGLVTPAVAQDTSDWRFGGDAYVAGRTVSITGEAVDDVFAAGDNVILRTDATGSVHMAGRYVTLDSHVAQDFYGAGMDVSVNGAVAGDVTAMGDSVSITEPVSGDLRATGDSVNVNAPVAGNAILAAANVRVDAAIMGDVALATPSVVWGDAASVAGTLHIYSDDPDSIDVPASVAPTDRIELHPSKAFDESIPGMEKPSFLSQLRGWLGGVLIVGLLGTAFAALAPEYVAGLRRRALAQPLRSGWIGFLGLSTLVGSVVFLAMTGIGVLLVPVSIIAAILLGIAGYVVGTYILGVWAVGVAGRGEPSSTGDRAIAAFAGAVIGALVGFVPWLGWLLMMAIFLVGAGALVVKMFAPGFRTDAA